MKQWQQAAQTESRDSQWQFPDKYCHTHIINVLADVEPSLSHAVIWESSTETEQADAEVYGSVAGFGNGLLEQEADRARMLCGTCGGVEWLSPSYLPLKSRCCQLCGAEILIGVCLLLRLALMDWRAESWGGNVGCRNTVSPTTGTDS